MSKTYKIEELEKMIAPAIMLRTPEQVIIDEYCDAMKLGTKFPPVTIGINAKKKDEIVLVDGLHRVRAARQAGILSLEAVEKTYASPDLLLADMYMLNKHGARVRPEDRDARIRLLNESHKWTQERIASEFSLDQSSVSRILAGKQKAGKTTGDKQARNKFTPMSSKAVIASAIKIVKSVAYKSVKTDLLKDCWIEKEGNTEKQNRKAGEHLDALKELSSMLKEFFAFAEKEMK